MALLATQIRGQLTELVDGMDVDVICGADAAVLVREFSLIEKIAASARTLAATRVADTSAWVGQGDRSAEDWLSRQTGTSVGAAARDLRTGRRVKDQPKTQAAMKQGTLSPEQAGAVADAVEADPTAEDDLIETAKRETYKHLQDKARRTRAAATDNAERARRHHRERSARTSTDADGAFCLNLRGPASDGARILGLLKPMQEAAFRAGRSAAADAVNRDTYDNRTYDAVLAMLLGGTIGAAHAASSTTPGDAAGAATPGRTATDAANAPANGSLGSSPSDGASAPGAEPARGNHHSPTGEAPSTGRTTNPPPPPPDSDPAPGHGHDPATDAPEQVPGARHAGEPTVDPSLFDTAATGAPVGPHQQAVAATTASAPHGDAAPTVEPSGQPPPGTTPPEMDLRDRDPFNAQPRNIAPSRAGPREPAHHRGTGASPVQTPTRLPGGNNVKVIVRVDHEALLRGHTVAGETSEIAGLGPVPVAVVREMLGDAFLAVVVRKGRDVVSVAHHGRGLNVHQRTAIEAAGLRCSNAACNQTVGIQIDHRHPWAKDQITKLDNQDPLCGPCHRRKTHDGWHLEAGTGPRRFLPPAPAG